MLESWRSRFRANAFAFANLSRQLTLVAVVAAVVVPNSLMGPTVQRLSMSTSAAAYAATHVVAASTVSTALPAPDVTPGVVSVWTADDWREWKNQVRRIPPPPTVAAGEPLTVDVKVMNERGDTIQGAQVAITWITPDGQFNDPRTTGFFGGASATRYISKAYRGKRLTVAVQVTGPDVWGAEYCDFIPR